MDTSPIHQGLSTARPAAPYSRRAPSPPFIQVPVPFLSADDCHLSLSPLLMHIVDRNCPPFEVMAAVLGQRHYIESQDPGAWHWNMRHEAQTVTPSILVGPSLVARNTQFLKDIGITMVITVIDPRLIPWQNGLRKSVQDAGLDIQFVPAETAGDLFRELNGTIALINRHLAEVFEKRVCAAGLDAHAVVREATAAYLSHDAKVIQAMEAKLEPFRGKVLLTCESGNSRSVTVAAAYLMATTGISLQLAVQFVSVRRFCVSFEEEHKRALLTWSEIVQAKLAVNGADCHDHTAIVVGDALMPHSCKATQVRPGGKRMIDDVYFGDDVPTALSSVDTNADGERYEGRPRFAPFIDAE